MTQPIETQAVAATSRAAGPPVSPPAPPPAPGHTPMIERVLQLEQRLAKYEPMIAAIVAELGL